MQPDPRSRWSSATAAPPATGRSTLASYDLAVRMGADVIEPDLVSTKDHQLVARHENDITGTTDGSSRPRFADRRTTKTVDGVTTTGVDGVFSDNPDLAFAAREDVLAASYGVEHPQARAR